MVTRPTSVTVLGQRYTVTWEPSDPGLLNEPDKTGRTDLVQQQMHIRSGMGFHQERETVLHEVLHAVLRFAALQESDTEERAVAVLAPIFLELLRRDHALVDWLLAEEPAP